LRDALVVDSVTVALREILKSCGKITANLSMASELTVQVNVKMSEEDFSLLKGASAVHWTDAILTNCGIVLGLAKIGARAASGKKR
jgi:hypothetical protein